MFDSCPNVVCRRLSSNVMLHDERNKSSQRLWDGVMAALTNCMSNPHNGSHVVL